MDNFYYKNGKLYCESVEVDSIKDKLGSPVFIYSSATLHDHFFAVKEAFREIDPLICFSIKSCANIHLLRLLQECGSGMDVVSGGELYRAKLAGTSASKIVFAGVGKSIAEIEQAIESGILLINAESESEVERISHIAFRMKKRVRVGVRINPDLSDPNTPQKTATGGRNTKFGVPTTVVPALFQKYLAHEYIDLCALHVHLGSPISSAEIYVKAIEVLKSLIIQIESLGGSIQMLDIGGGFPAHYDNKNEAVLSGKSILQELASAISTHLAPLRQKGIQFIIEPGRIISANAGILLAEVEYVKRGWDNTIIVLNVGMNALIRPTLYGAKHKIWPSRLDTFNGHWNEMDEDTLKMLGLPLEKIDIVGPICETGDFFALQREFPKVSEGECIAMFSCGAYGMTMASQYNSRPRPAEVLVDGANFRTIRMAENYEDLILLEKEEKTR